MTSPGLLHENRLDGHAVVASSANNYYSERGDSAARGDGSNGRGSPATDSVVTNSDNSEVVPSRDSSASVGLANSTLTLGRDKHLQQVHTN